MSGGKFGNDKFDCNGPEAVRDVPHHVAYHNDRKVTLTVLLDGPDIEHVACMELGPYELRDAMHAIKSNDAGLGAVFDGQTASQQGEIMRSRDVLWHTISSSMQKFFFEKIFAKNDTHNGYTKGEQ